MQSKSVLALTGTVAQLVAHPAFADYMDPQYYPPYDPADPSTILSLLEGLDLIKSLSDSTPQNIGEPGWGYVSAHVFISSEDDSYGARGGQLRLTRLNDNGVGNNFGLEGVSGLPDDQADEIDRILGRGVWYWGDRTYYTSADYSNAQPLTPEELGVLNSFLGDLVSKYLFTVISWEQ
jgi:hypothetical protein